jgi:hypothetical protein
VCTDWIDGYLLLLFLKLIYILRNLYLKSIEREYIKRVFELPFSLPYRPNLTYIDQSTVHIVSLLVNLPPGMHFLAGVNRVSALIRENKLDSKLRNENYCIENLGTRAAQVIMDAIDSSSLLSKINFTLEK